MIKVCLAGATGWAGSELARSIAETATLPSLPPSRASTRAAVLGEVLGEPRLTCPVHRSAEEALVGPCDVFVEYTKPDSAKANILAALERGAHVVVGTSGLTEEDYAEIDVVARERRRGVLACGNFALTVVLLLKFAEAAARLIPQWEIIDYAHDDKIDAPSGTARELAARLSEVRHPEPTVPVDRHRGSARSAGATVSAPRFTPSVCRLRDQRRDHLRDAGPETDDPPRLGQQRSPLRRWGLARDSQGIDAGRRPPRSGSRARPLIHPRTWLR